MALDACPKATVRIGSRRVRHLQQSRLSTENTTPAGRSGELGAERTAGIGQEPPLAVVSNFYKSGHCALVIRGADFDDVVCAVEPSKYSRSLQFPKRDNLFVSTQNSYCSSCSFYVYDGTTG